MQVKRNFRRLIGPHGLKINGGLVRPRKTNVHLDVDALHKIAAVNAEHLPNSALFSLAEVVERLRDSVLILPKDVLAVLAAIEVISIREKSGRRNQNGEKRLAVQVARSWREVGETKVTRALKMLNGKGTWKYAIAVVAGDYRTLDLACAAIRREVDKEWGWLRGENTTHSRGKVDARKNLAAFKVGLASLRDIIDSPDFRSTFVEYCVFVGVGSEHGTLKETANVQACVEIAHTGSAPNLEEPPVAGIDAIPTLSLTTPGAVTYAGLSRDTEDIGTQVASLIWDTNSQESAAKAAEFYLLANHPIEPSSLKPAELAVQSSAPPEQPWSSSVRVVTTATAGELELVGREVSRPNENQHLIIQGDAISTMQLMEDKFVDLIVTDIPYGEVNGERFREGGLRNIDKGKADKVTFDLAEFIRESVRVCRGSFYIFCGEKQASSIVGLFEEYDLIGIRSSVWEKTNQAPSNGHLQWLSSTEHFVFARHRKATFNGWCESPVLRGPRARPNGHPTPKPTWILRKMIWKSSNPGDLILDPCLGSGSTSVAAAELGRSSIGIEMCPEFVSMAEHRVREAVEAQNRFHKMAS